MTTTVAFVSHTASASGAEAVLLSLAHRAQSDGHAVVVACPTGDLSARLPAGVSHVPLPKLGLSADSGWRRGVAMLGLPFKWVRAAVALRGLCVSPSTSVVVNSLFALPAVRLTLRRRSSTWLVHDTVTARKQRLIVRFSARALRRAVAVSHTTAEQLCDFGFPVEVAYNGVDIGPRGNLTHSSPPVIGVLAKLTPWKGHRVLLAALQAVPGVAVEFAGDHFPGEQAYVDELHRLADAPGVAGRVRFLGHSDARSCLSRWTALVSPSTGPEAGPLGVLEAMASGTPVIATDHGGSAEYLSDGAGLLVPPGDPEALAGAISAVLSDSELREALAGKAYARVRERHDRTVTTPAMLRLLIAQRSQAPAITPAP